jgi:inosose dehydratase
MLNVGNAPLSWGVFEGDDATNPPWPVVLDEIAEAGYRYMELGPIGFLPEDTDLLAKELERRGISLLGGFVYEHMHDPSYESVVLENSRRVCRVLSTLGARFVVVIDRMVMDRRRTAGRSEDAERLSDPGWDYMMGAISKVAAIAGQEFGLRPVLHPHCGTHIEFDDEIDRALGDLPSSTIGFCVDTAHAVVAGMQPRELADRYPSRLEYLHFKDVDRLAQQRMFRERLEFEEALAIGLFCPLGKGIVDFPGLRHSLERASFAGAATVEQDPDPRVASHSGLDAAKESIEFLRQVGLADER